MKDLVALFLIILPVVLSLFSPSALIYFAILTGALPIFSFDYLSTPFGRLEFSAIKLLGVCLAALIYIVFNSKTTLQYLLKYKFHFIFLLFSMLSLIWAPSEIFGIRMLLKLAAPFLMLIVFMAGISKERQLRTVKTLMLFSGTLIVFMAFATKLAGTIAPIPGIDPELGLTVPYTSPAVFSAHLLAVSMLGFAILRYKKTFKNLFLVTLFAIAILLAFTRIAIAGIFVGFSVISFIAMRGFARIAIPIGSVLGFLSLFLFNNKFKERMFLNSANKITASSFIDDPSTVVDHIAGSGRYAAWKQVISRFFDPSPLIGSGVGATQDFFYSNSLSGLGVIHSEYIRLLSEVGIIGLILFVLMVLAYAARLLTNFRRASHVEAKTYAAAAIGALVVYLVFMATDNAFDYANQFGIYVFVLVAMSEKLRELDIRRLRSSAPHLTETSVVRVPHITQSPVIANR